MLRIDVHFHLAGHDIALPLVLNAGANPARQIIADIKEILYHPNNHIPNQIRGIEIQMRPVKDEQERVTLLDRLDKIHWLHVDHRSLIQDLLYADSPIQTFLPALTGNKTYNAEERRDALARIGWCRDYARYFPDGVKIQEKLRQLEEVLKTEFSQTEHVFGLVRFTKRPGFKSAPTPASEPKLA